MTDPRIDKWTRWIEGPIRSNVLTMYLHRDTWQELAKVIEDHGSLPDSYFWEYYRDIYAANQAMAVRRQADTDHRAASLGRLLVEVGDAAELITRDFWLELWRKPDEDPYWVQVAEKQWCEHFAGDVGDHLDPSVPARQLAELQSAAEAIKGYADRHVAHTDTRAVGTEVTFTLNDVHVPIDVIGQLFRRYNSLFTASDYAVMVPAIQHDWLAPFRQPWIPPRPGERPGHAGGATRPRA